WLDQVHLRCAHLPRPASSTSPTSDRPRHLSQPENGGLKQLA
ncbi:MAG: hypothetical protein AVDCRST_MAG75-2647, partial [uncultured Propionibacteriaceae bacterium]